MRIDEVLAFLDFRRKLINIRCSTYSGKFGYAEERSQHRGFADAVCARNAAPKLPSIKPLPQKRQRSPIAELGLELVPMVCHQISTGEGPTDHPTVRIAR